MKHAILLTTCAAAIALSGCALTTAGLKKGDEKSFTRSLNDVNAGRAIKARMRRAEGFKLNDVDVEVVEGVVLLSGDVPRPEDRIEAERIAWSASQVFQVGNEIVLGDDTGFIRDTKDVVLHQSVMARLIANKSTKARNFNVEVHNGKVYLMGVARTEAELKEAAQIASTTRGAKEVISYVTLAGQAPGKGYASVQNYQPGMIGGAPAQPYTTAPGPSSPITGAIPYTAPSPSPYDTGLTPGTAVPAPAIPQESLDMPVVKDPDAIDSGEPYFVDPQTGERIELPPGVTPIPYAPPTPGGLGAGGSPLPPGAKPTQILGQGGGTRELAEMPTSLPSDNQLGSFRTGAAGEAVSIIESAPYVIDPHTGEEIPVLFDNRGQSYLIK